ncbi:abc transporter, putative [Perkinsus marinus ATCC 50983]|uniref:Abc transporter, putative n=1 Tax=Perkinsus marinus (strain ATCC 50983 / TXsc) TaxID=423536 RepID=C5M161_PERM5|nr:abc transporter, putative [Perkinsus marinus ATCC 50983]EEQ97291.1 abc transporter, putative [Perkinsus marinus ATCC 50983]|eukprot:XP_002764574.1 abc transporter, putative [Perkinsus marinus ATCC 50983]
MAGCFAPNPKTAMEAGPLLFVPQILFAGFFVDLSEVPAFLRWVQYLCSLKYAMNLLFLAEFSDQPGGEVVLEANDVEEDLKWAYILLLLALLITFRLIGLIGLTRKAITVY